MDERCEKKHNVYRIGKPLLVFGIFRAIWVESPAVVSGLNFARQFGTIGVAMMQQQLARAQPSRIKIGKVPAWAVVSGSVGALVWDQDSPGIEPHAAGQKQRDE